MSLTTTTSQAQENKEKEPLILTRGSLFDSKDDSPTSQEESKNSNTTRFSLNDGKSILESMLFSNLDIIIRDFNQAFDHLNAAHEKSLTLFIGKTGAGKSLLLNYLKQVHIVVDHTYGKPRLELRPRPGETIYSAVGHGRESKTCYPQVVLADDSSGFCDCPGYFSTEGPSARVTTLITTQMAIKRAKEIKAVFVLIPFDDITDRALPFDDLIEIISEIFKNLEKALPSVYFAFNKLDEGIDLNSIIKNLEEFVKAEEKKLKNQVQKMEEELKNVPLTTEVNINLREVFEIDKISKKLQILNFILQSKNHILLVRPADNGKSREEILKCILSSTPISHDYFKLPEMDTNLNAFKKVILNLADNGIKIIENIDSVKKDIERNAEILTDYEQQLKNMNQNLEQLKERKSNARDLAILSSNSEAKLKNIQKRLATYGSDCKNFKLETDRLSAEIEAIDRNEPVRYWREEEQFPPDRFVIGLTIASVCLLGLAIGLCFVPGGAVAEIAGAAYFVRLAMGVTTLGLTATSKELLQRLLMRLTHHTFSYGPDIQLSSHSSTCTHGFYHNEIIETNSYRVTFYPNPYLSSNASVEVSVPMRSLPENALKIARDRLNITLLNEKISETKEKIDLDKETEIAYQKELNRINQKIKQLSGTDHSKEHKVMREELNVFLERSIQDLGLDIKQTEKYIESLKEKIAKKTGQRHELEEQFRTREKYYQFLYLLSEFVDYNLKDFLEAYKSLSSKAPSMETEHQYQSLRNILKERREENKLDTLIKPTRRKWATGSLSSNLASEVSSSSSSSTVASSPSISSTFQYGFVGASPAPIDQEQKKVNLNSGNSPRSTISSRSSSQQIENIHKKKSCTLITREIFKKSLDEFQKAFETQDKFLDQYLEKNPSDREIAIACAKDLRNQYLRLKSDLEHLKEAQEEIKEMECKAFEQELRVAAANIEKIEISYAKIKPLPIIKSTSESLAELSQSPGVKSPIHSPTTSSSTSGVTASNNGSPSSNTTTTILYN